MCLIISDARTTFDLIKNVSRKFRPRNWDQSDPKLCIYLIEQALHFSNDPSLDSASDSLGFVAAQAIDFIHSLLSWTTQLNQNVAVRGNLSRCLKVLFETFSRMNDLGMWNSEKYQCVPPLLSDPLPIGLSVARPFTLETRPRKSRDCF